MGQGGYIFCEWDSISKAYPDYQLAFADLEEEIIAHCNSNWGPKTFGGLVPDSGQYGRTTILPALFDPNPNTYNGKAFGTTAFDATWPTPPTYWRQAFTQPGHQILLQGNQAGETLNEDFNIAWMGLAFPNKNQHLTEIRWQTSDRKFGRLNIEEMNIYNKPAIIFEEGFPIKEEQAFELYGYFEGPIPESPFSPTILHPSQTTATPAVGYDYCAYQRIVMLGAAYYRIIDKVLGAPGAAI